MHLDFPQTDPTPIFDLFRSGQATELLTVAVAHLHFFEAFPNGPATEDALRSAVGLGERGWRVLTTGLRAMGLLRREPDGRYELTPIAREHLVAGAPFEATGYVRLAANQPGVLALAERFRTDRPAGAAAPEGGALGAGTTHIFRPGVPSALEREASARVATLSLAGRARNVAPYLGARLNLPDTRVLLDVGGGSGIYAYALLRTHPAMRAVILDRPEVLKVAREFATEYGVAERVEFLAADLLGDALPPADAVLLSNVLHDWDTDDCRRLVARAAAVLPKGGRLLIHDVFLDDDLGGPLPIALYSVLLFALTEGRAYSRAEFAGWLGEAGLEPQPVVPTLAHCGVLTGWRPGP